MLKVPGNLAAQQLAVNFRAPVFTQHIGSLNLGVCLAPTVRGFLDYTIDGAPRSYIVALPIAGSETFSIETPDGGAETLPFDAMDLSINPDHVAVIAQGHPKRKSAYEFIGGFLATAIGENSFQRTLFSYTPGLPKGTRDPARIRERNEEEVRVYVEAAADYLFTHGELIEAEESQMRSAFFMVSDRRIFDLFQTAIFRKARDHAPHQHTDLITTIAPFRRGW